MSAYHIEKGIPLPTMPTNMKYPWRDMKVGDSFFVPVKKESERTMRGAITSSFYNYQRGNRGQRIALRQVKGGFRIWRVA